MKSGPPSERGGRCHGPWHRRGLPSADRPRDRRRSRACRRIPSPARALRDDSAHPDRRPRCSRPREKRSSRRMLGKVLERFRDGFFPGQYAAIKERFEALKRSVSPDLVLTHYRGDLHKDHRLVAELTWNTFRNHFVLEYEIPKYDGDFGSPNVFVPLDRQLCQRKIRHLLDSFPSQASRAWFEEDTFSALLRLRGMEANAPSGYAEAFYCRKFVLDAG